MRICFASSVLFDVDGLRLFAGCHNVLKVFTWPTNTCVESLPINWGDVADMALTQNFLVSHGVSSTAAAAVVRCCYVHGGTLKGGPGGPWPTQNFGPGNNWPVCLLVVACKI